MVNAKVAIQDFSASESSYLTEKIRKTGRWKRPPKQARSKESTYRHSVRSDFMKKTAFVLMSIYY